MSSPNPPDPPILILPPSMLTYYCGSGSATLSEGKNWTGCAVHGIMCPFQPSGNPAHRFNRTFINTNKICKAHQVPCKLLTVKKEGPNHGRKFYVCGDPTQCDHFEWTTDTGTEEEKIITDMEVETK
jgi:GRF zinc finger